MSASKLSEVSTDILRLIVEEISYKPDLVATCLTCKRLYDVALPGLYNEIEIDVGTEKDVKLAQLFNSRNPGIKHIKELTLNYPDDAEKKQAQLAIAMILEALPFQQLENFHWNSWNSVSLKNVELLCRRQRNLKDVEVMHLDEKLTDDVAERLDFDTVITDDLERLYLYMNSPDSIEYAHQLLKRAKKPLKHLRIHLHAHFQPENEDTPDNPLQDTVDHSGRIYRTLFKHQIGQENRLPLQTNSLNLHKITLHRAESWFRMLDVNKLTSLQLYRCEGAPEALGVICRNSPSSLQLRDFTIEHCENASGGDVRGAINTFLSVVPKLKSISIDLCCATHMVRTQGICRHGSSLKYLNVFEAQNHDESDFLYYEPPEIKEIAKKCPQLEQLSLAGVNAEITDVNTEGELAGLQDALLGKDSALSNLHTLQFVTWPYTNKIETKIPRSLYDQMLQAQALAMFRARDKSPPKLPKLSIAAWGSYKNDNHFTIFVRGTQSTLLGQSQTAAIPVTSDWITHNHYGPRDILKTEHIKRFIPPDVSDRSSSTDLMPTDVKRK